MLKLNAENSGIYFKDIKPDHLPQILEWYNKVDDFKYATGIDKPISLSTLMGRYAEVAISCNEFFVGIFIKPQNTMIGILKGRIRYRNKAAVWISSIVIDPGYQSKGYGMKSIDLLLNHLSKQTGVNSAYLAVVEENIQGRNFWNKLGFREVRKIDKHLLLQDKYMDVIIMYRLV